MSSAVSDTELKARPTTGWRRSQGSRAGCPRLAGTWPCPTSRRKLCESLRAGAEPRMCHSASGRRTTQVALSTAR